MTGLIDPPVEQYVYSFGTISFVFLHSFWIFLWLSLWTTSNTWHVMSPFSAHTTWTSLYECGLSSTLEPRKFLFCATSVLKVTVSSSFNHLYFDGSIIEYDHSFSYNPTTMISHKCPIIGKQVVLILIIIWLTGWLAGWLAGWLTDRQTDRLTDRQIDWLTDRLTDWLADWLTDWLTDWQIDRLTDWLTGWLADRQIDWLVDRQIDWLADGQIDWLTDRQTDWPTH